MNKLRAIWLVITSRAFYVQTEQGFSSHVPADPDIIAGIQDSARHFDSWLEEYYEQSK